MQEERSDCYLLVDNDWNNMTTPLQTFVIKEQLLLQTQGIGSKSIAAKNDVM